MSVLVANDDYDFNSLKEIIGITDGNMASHMKALEREKYISVINLLRIESQTQNTKRPIAADLFLKNTWMGWSN